VAVQVLVLGQRPVVPGVDERLGGDGGAVGELPVLERDRPDGAVVVGLDGLGNLVDDGAVGVVSHQTGKDVVERVATAHLVGGRGDQRVLRVGAVDGDDGLAIRAS